MFQHTAARRRLQGRFVVNTYPLQVSTHSRAEAAAKTASRFILRSGVSTHSRAEAAAPYIKK